jgi:cytochrome c-type biogenesis protein CcmH
MLQLLITGLAGLVCGVVLMRVFQQNNSVADKAVGADAAGSSDQSSPKATEGSEIGNSGNSLPGKLRLIWNKLTSAQKMLGGAGVLAAIAVIALFAKSDDQDSTASEQGTATSITGTPAKGLEPVDIMITRLEEKLKSDPKNGEGFRMLGWSYANTGNPQKAMEAYKQAVALLPARADVFAGYGEALVGVANGSVSADAKSQFDKAIAIDKSEPRARFFLSLFKSQNGSEKEALDEWIALANESSAEMPWQPDLRQRIDTLAKKLGVNVSGRLKAAAPKSISDTASAPPIAPATMQAASTLPPAQQQGMINGMVEGLAVKLKDNSKDVEGWVKLLRSRMVLGQKDQASQDLATAKKALAGNNEALKILDGAAAEFSIPSS